MTLPWEKPAPVALPKRMPWEPLPPELVKDAVGLWPGQQHPNDIPDFLRRKPK